MRDSAHEIGRLGLLALLAPLAVWAGTARGAASGGAIPAGAFVTSGTVVSDIVLTDSGNVASGNAVTVNLLGLQHDFAGDLRITLSYIDNTGVTRQTVDVVNRIGATSANPYGTSADFGNNQGLGDNYQFNTDYPGDIWAAAACSDPPACTTPYGDADAIPGVSTDTLRNGQYFTSTSGGAKTTLSYAFAGLSVSGGKWRLTITDLADPNAGSFVGWEIVVVTAGSASSPQTVTAVAGTPQSAVVGTSFASALQAKVTDSAGNPVSGITVTFSAPSSGASATFSGSASATAMTNSAGIAISPVPFANAIAGSYSVTATVTGLAPASFSLTNTGASSSASAQFQKIDSSTLGNWKGAYGTDGAIIPNDSSRLPAYATATFSNALTWTWTASSSDARALLKSASSTDRIASTYYNLPSFTADVNFTDGQAHQLALYLADWDYGNRTESISINDAASGAALDTRTASNFQGQYYVWKVQGHVLIQVTRQLGNNAIINGIFFDPSGGGPAVSVTAPAAGAVVSGLVAVSAQATASSGSVSSVQFLLDGGALGAPVTGAGPAYTTSWSSTGTPNGAHTLAATATDSTGRTATSAAVPVTVSNTSSGSASAVFQKTDTATFGNWKGVYGADGSIIPNDSARLPAYAAVNFSNAALWTWLSSTSDPRALLKGGSSTDRIASTYYNLPSFTIDVNFTDGQAHQIALYLADWDYGNRTETISFIDAASGAVLDTRTPSAFQGQYWVWKVQGRVLIQVTRQNGNNAIVNGIFFDPAAGGSSSASAVFQKTDSATLGNWKGVYGADGSIVANDSSNLPGYASAAFSNASTWTWLASTSDSRALLKYSSSADRISSTYYNASGFSVDLNFSDGQAHQTALYLCDWDYGNRIETISFIDAASGAVLDTRTASAFQGQYWVWKVQGHVVVRIAWQAGNNAVLNGMFFDAAK